MHILIATDAWPPQVNGVVRTLLSVAEAMRRQGARVSFLSPDGFPTFPVPTYPELRLALPSPGEIARRIERAKPDVVHLATEGTIGFMVRRHCLRHGVPFTSSYTTRFPEYLSARLPIPDTWSYNVLRRFHNASAVTMVSTPSLIEELSGRGFTDLGLWTRGVDTELFKPERAIDLRLPRPIFVTVGRVAVEKNLAAFLSLDLPGTKVVIGKGPMEAELRRRFPEAKFLGHLQDEVLAAHVAGADVFVFPSLTDTFGVVQLEALACGVPVAAYPAVGSRDAIGDHPVGVIDADLRAACLKALHVPRAACRAFALTRSWDVSARQFLEHASRACGLPIAPAAAPPPAPAVAHNAA
ncbi:MAG TPA: glycosyltransferase family 1 protein [Xanthobacteraceae bacterium]|nr:glycosyltransferase family 1 protein [Xanthobacteraceae bacterium]